MGELCSDEQTTLHHLGTGHGPVQDAEIIIFAVFAKTQRKENKLTADSFRNNLLTRGQLSVARKLYTTKSDFIDQVLTPGAVREGGAEGGCTVCVCDIRHKVLIAPDVTAPDKRMRAVCVLDLVLDGDHEGHATLKYADLPGPISPGRLGSLRALIREDLAARFSMIASCEQIWAA